MRSLLPVVAALAAVPASAAIEDQNVPRPATEQPPAPQPALTRAPELAQFVDAEYPPALLATGVGGEVVMVIDIDVDGLVERVETVSSTHPDFVEPAMAAATQFVFVPAEVDGKPSGIRLEYRYVFQPKVALPPAPSPASQLPVNFSGVVLEAGVRTPLAGARISIDGKPVAETDALGKFAVRGVPAGTIAVQVSAPRFRPYEVSEVITPGEALLAKYYLVRLSSDAYETVVRGKDDKREVAKVQLERKELEKVPGTFGDPVRVIENLPGMARTPGGLGGALLVRGANPSDSRVYLDGVEIPLLYHFGGLTSVVAAGFLERIDFFPGGFGARYGGAIAGIVDVVTRDLDCDLWRGYGRVDVIDAAAYSCNEAYGFAFAAAGRRSHIDTVLPFVLDAAPRQADEGVATVTPVYWDYQAKSHGKVGDHSLDLFLFGSNDRLQAILAGSAEDLNFTAGLHLAFHRIALRDRWRITDHATLLTTFSPGLETREFTQTIEELGATNEFGVYIRGFQWREELQLELLDNVKLVAGIEAAIGGARLELDVPFPNELRNPYPAPTFDYTDTNRFETEIRASNHAYYLETVVDLPFGLRFIPGLRIDRWDFHRTQDFSIQPRLSARWEIRDGMAVKAAWGVYEKLPEEPYLMERPIGNPKLEPLRSLHYVVGYEHTFTPLVNADLQLFYNDRSREPVRSDSFVIKDGERIPQVWSSDGLGRTYGLELLLRHLASADGWFYGWVAYTLSRSWRQDRRPDATQALSGGGQDAGTFREPDDRDREYLSPFDQTHILTIVAQLVLPRGFEVGARYRLVSGNPYTPLEDGRAYYDADEQDYELYTEGVERNSKRLPTFHQLDLRIDKTFIFDLWKLTAYLEVLNVYNAKNVEQYQYDYRFRERAPLTLLPIVPVLGVKGEF